jgi:hypothetical protein
MYGTNKRGTPRRRTTALVVYLAIIGAACASGGEVVAPSTLNVPETIALGSLPAPLAAQVVVPDPPTTESTVVATTTTLPPLRPLLGPVGEQVSGNRIIVIGDAHLASTATRFDGSMCDVLETFGWAVEVNAEPGRVVEFGSDVLDLRLTPEEEPPWDVAAIMFGNTFDGDIDAFQSDLDDMLERLEPRPVIVYTVTDADGSLAAANAVIRELPRFHPNIVVIDWAEFSRNDEEELVASDGSGLTEAGSDRLALYTAGALGPAPGSPEGGCLTSAFTDDSNLDES